MPKPRVSMSEHIRDVLSENPSFTGPEIMAALAEKGIYPKKDIVYYVKARFKAKKRRQTSRKVAKLVSSTNGSLDPVVLISKTKALAAELGGMAKLKELVDALS